MEERYCILKINRNVFLCLGNGTHIDQTIFKLSQMYFFPEPKERESIAQAGSFQNNLGEESIEWESTIKLDS